MQPMCLTVQIHLAFASKEKSTLGLRATVLEGLKSSTFRSLEFFHSNICSLNCKVNIFVFKITLSFRGGAAFLGG